MQPFVNHSNVKCIFTLFGIHHIKNETPVCINQLQPVIFYFSTLIYYISKPRGLIASYYYLFSKIIALLLVSYSFLSEIVKWIQIERDTE